MQRNLLQTTKWVAAWSGAVMLLAVTVFAQTQAGATEPLTALVKSYDLAALQGRLSSGANPNEIGDSEGSTPLMEAARNGDLTILKALISAGADINARNTAGRSVVALAAAYGNDKCVMALLSQGADVKGQTIRLLLFEPYDDAVVRTLEGHGATVQVSKGVISKPTVIEKVHPTYSKEARKAKVKGTVMLSVVVAPEGRARDIRVLKALGYGLDEKAIEAVQ
jgi:hypothetical protein